MLNTSGWQTLNSRINLILSPQECLNLTVVFPSDFPFQNYVSLCISQIVTSHSCFVLLVLISLTIIFMDHESSNSSRFSVMQFPFTASTCSANIAQQILKQPQIMFFLSGADRISLPKRRRKCYQLGRYLTFRFLDTAAITYLLIYLLTYLLIYLLI